MRISYQEYLTFSIDERNELIAEYNRIGDILPPVEKKRRLEERKKAKLAADREKKRKKMEEERPQRIKEYERRRNLRRKKEREKLSAKKKAQKEAAKKRETEKLALEREKKREKEKAKRLAQLERDKVKKQKQKEAKSARLKLLRDQKRNTYKRKKRAIARIKRLRSQKKNINKQIYRIGIRPFLEEIKWLKFCNKTPEERDAYVALRRKQRKRGPKEFTRKWLNGIRHREIMKRRRAQKREAIAERNRQKRLKKFNSMLNPGEDVQNLRNSLAVNNCVTQQRIKLLAEREINGDEKGKFAIYTFVNKRARRCIVTKQWREDIIEAYETYIEKRLNKTIVPDMRGSGTHEVYLVRDAKLNEDPSTFTRDKNGRLVRDTTFDETNWVILRKDIWYDEELFYVYGYHPIEDKKDFTFIYKNILVKGNSKDHYSSKQVMVHNTKVIIIGDDNFDIIVARNNEVANMLYSSLQEKYEKNGGKKVFFLGTMGEVTWQKFLPEMQEKTGWPEEDCVSCNLASF